VGLRVEDHDRQRQEPGVAALTIDPAARSGEVFTFVEVPLF
jgi:hypothetical protein